MTIGEKIKWMRSGKNMSQADLADALGVSRQAVTKWETDSGNPEIENLKALASLFGTSVDAIISDDMPCYTSLIQYDIDMGKDFELELVPSKNVIIEGSESEKVGIEMMSDRIPTLDSDLKVSIEDRKRKMSVEMRRKNDLTESACLEDLSIRIRLPKRYIQRIELKCNLSQLDLRGFATEDIEFEGSAEVITLSDVHGQAEMDIHKGCLFKVADLDGSLEINQFETDSIVEVPADLKFFAKNAGRKCALELKDGLASVDDCEDFIELNGMKSKLTIRKSA